MFGDCGGGVERIDEGGQGEDLGTEGVAVELEPQAELAEELGVLGRAAGREFVFEISDNQSGKVGVLKPEFLAFQQPGLGEFDDRASVLTSSAKTAVETEWTGNAMRGRADVIIVLLEAVRTEDPATLFRLRVSYQTSKADRWFHLWLSPDFRSSQRPAFGSVFRPSLSVSASVVVGAGNVLPFKNLLSTVMTCRLNFSFDASTALFLEAFGELVQKRQNVMFSAKSDFVLIKAVLKLQNDVFFL